MVLGLLYIYKCALLLQTDLYGQNIINITHPDDHSFLKQKLIPTDLESLFDLHPLENGEPRPRSREEEEMIDSKLSGDRRDFTIRFVEIEYDNQR